jgi:hypothetical protein
MNYKRLSQPKTVRFIILGSIILSLFFGQLHYKQWQKKRQIAKEIAELTKQQQAIEQKKQGTRRIFGLSNLWELQRKNRQATA